MTPWWLRPPAESAEDDSKKKDEKKKTKDDEDSGPASIVDAAAAVADEPVAEESDEERTSSRPGRRRRRRRDGGGRRSGAAEAAAEGGEEREEREAKPAVERPQEPERQRPPEPEEESRPRSRGRRRRAPAPERPAGGDGGADLPAKLEQEMERLRSALDEAVESLAEREENLNDTDERTIALFCDLENIALGVRDDKNIDRFEIHLVLERLLEKGKIIVKRAYADWGAYSEYKRAFHEAGIELIDIPKKRYSGKNSADIKMVVDAMDLSFSKEHVDTFVVLSGDSDFSPLVSKLKENNKRVIGMGVKNSSSNLLIDSCDEFIFYEDVSRDVGDGSGRKTSLDALPKKKAEVFRLIIDAVKALQREGKDVLWGSMIKQTMQRKKPSFNEGYYGYSTLSDLLEDAQKHGILKLKKDQRSGSYIIVSVSGAR